ncbi:MAG: azurin [Verrucomicrobia bacterium]|nr:azurin [Verrucomicrobiota bacterium]
MKRMTLLSWAVAGMVIGSYAFGAEVAVTITGNDQMQFDKKAFEVKVGDTITLTLKNVGVLPIVAMGHNLVMLKSGEEIAPFAIAAMSAKEQDYIPPAMTDKIIAHTRLLGPGEEDVITFTAPAAGEYKYLCTFPGHFAVMNGVMTVK